VLVNLSAWIVERQDVWVRVALLSGHSPCYHTSIPDWRQIGCINSALNAKLPGHHAGPVVTPLWGVRGLATPEETAHRAVATI
jgi:hypothetical protein